MGDDGTGPVQFALLTPATDSVLRSDAANLLRMARNFLLRNAHTRMPFPGVAAFYRALFGGPDGRTMHPLLYVSGSPWNPYHLLSRFFSSPSHPRELYVEDVLMCTVGLLGPATGRVGLGAAGRTQARDVRAYRLALLDPR